VAHKWRATRRGQVGSRGNWNGFLASNPLAPYLQEVQVLLSAKNLRKIQASGENSWCQVHKTNQMISALSKSKADKKGALSHEDPTDFVVEGGKGTNVEGVAVDAKAQDAVDSKHLCISVQTLDGRSFSVQIPSNAAVIDVKKEVERQDNAPVFSQRLYFAGMELENATQLSVCGIADISELCLVTSLGPAKYTIPGGSIGGAHTSNPSYYKRHEDGSLELLSVCWLDVAGSVTAVNLDENGVGGICPGKYQIIVQFSGRLQMHWVSVSAKIRPIQIDTEPVEPKLGAEIPSVPTEWVTALQQDWQPSSSEKGSEYVLGEITIEEQSEVSVSFYQTEGGWKSDLTWEQVVLTRVD
jgi:hypothetical protein